MPSAKALDLSLMCQGHARRCLVYDPHEAATVPRPLLLMLHGAGATASWALEETGWDCTADREGFVVALPEALPLDPQKPLHFHRNPSWWNDLSPASQAARREVDDVHFLSVLLTELERCKPIDRDRVFVTGFSNGAAMTFRLAAEGTHKLSAIAPVAGYCWVNAPQLSRPMPTLYLIGSEDPLVPLHGGEVRSPWGWTETRPPVQESIDRWTVALAGRVSFEVQVINGLGHHWPGGRGVLSRRLFGPPSDAVKGNERIWEFCQSR